MNTSTQTIKRLLMKMSMPLLPFLDSLIYAGGFSERILVRLLLLVYDSKFRKEWMHAAQPPHFTDFRTIGANFILGRQLFGPYSFYRGFFSSEVIRQGDELLDIGCGDGFFSSRFFSEKCAYVDALDIDANAIREACTYNRAPNVSYHLADAIKDPFPKNAYDVIVWDGAIGHFPPSDIADMLRKISSCMKPDGIFTGSESLGVEGHDHFQFFETMEDLGDLFRPYFKYVKLKQVKYQLRQSDFIRTEAFWQCSNSPRRFSENEWTLIST